MARGPEIPKHDAERALKVLEYEKRTEPKYRQPGSVGSCLVLIIALAIAGAIVYYILMHREQFGQLWHRATHPDSTPVQTVPGQ